VYERKGARYEKNGRKNNVMKKKGKNRRRSRLQIIHALMLINGSFILFSASVILFLMWNASEQNARQLTVSLLTEMNTSVINKTQEYFASAERANRNSTLLLYRYFQNPIENEAEAANLFLFYADIFYLYPHFKMQYYSDTNGNLVMLNRMADGTFSERRVRNDGKEIEVIWNHVNPLYTGNYPNTQESAATGYDPRKRIWYTLAEEQKKLAWTPIYLFATDHLPGFTCAQPIYRPDGSLKGVSCVDISVEQLSTFLGTIQPTPGTRIVILSKENDLIAIQAKTQRDFDMLFNKTEDENNTASYALNSIGKLADWERGLYTKMIAQGGGIHSVSYDDHVYETIISPVVAGEGLEFNIGIIIPQEDIIGGIRQNLIRTALISAGMLGLIIVISFFFSNAIASPLKMLSKAMMEIRTLGFDSDIAVHTDLREIIEMIDSFDSMKNGLKSFKRYVPADLVGMLVNDKVVAEIGGEKQEITLLFSDIANFTTISEKIPAESLTKDLGAYFELISKTIIENQGTIDKYIGDAVMAFWNAPVMIENHAQQACRSALLIQHGLASLFRQWSNAGKTPFYTRIGIHTGLAIVGNMGYRERLNYTAVGDTVNIASRLESANKIYGTSLIVSEDAYHQCRDDFEFRRLDKISVAGRTGSLMVYELCALKDDIDKTMKTLFKYYEAGLKLYFDRNFEEAHKYFTYVLKNLPEDGPSKVMGARCVQYRKTPPPENWDGTYIQRK
jgi:adenylate cyclase